MNEDKEMTKKTHQLAKKKTPYWSEGIYVCTHISQEVNIFNSQRKEKQCPLVIKLKSGER